MPAALAKPDFALYTRNSKAFIAICRRFAPVVEQVSIDECFLDMTGTSLFVSGPYRHCAITIKDTIFSELGFTVNVGIAPNKLLAKMASDFEKPNKVHTLFASEIPQKLWPLPVGALYSVPAPRDGEQVDRVSNPHGSVSWRRQTFFARKSSSASRWESSSTITQTEWILFTCWQSRVPSKATVTLWTLEEDVTDTAAQANKNPAGTLVTAWPLDARDGRRCSCVTATIRGNDFPKQIPPEKASRSRPDVTAEVFALSKNAVFRAVDGYTGRCGCSA